ncbi:MAG: L-threonylcarbamoyladenylate synthase [Acidimicrobiales bacterium]
MSPELEPAPEPEPVPVADLEAQLEEAAETIRAGDVIGLPTDTVYGIGVDPTRPDASRRLFGVKGRPEKAALPLLIANPEDANRFARLDSRALGLIERHWPGPLTLVLPRRSGRQALYLGGDPATVGLRCPNQPTARRLLGRTGALAVTSANRHGEPPAETAEALRASLGEVVRVVIDGGRCDGAPSTVVSLLGPVPVILRQGAITAGDLFGEGTEPAQS